MSLRPEQRDALRALSALRLAMGSAVFLAPGLLTRLVGTDPTPGARFTARVFATREVALALLTLDAAGRERVPAHVLDVNMIVDGFDGLAALLARRGIPRLTRLVSLSGAAGAVATVGAMRSRLS